MSTEIATVPAAPQAPGFANPLKQISGILGQPAVRRSLPMILMIGLIAAASLAWTMLATPTQRVLFSNLSDCDKASVTQALTAANISSDIDDAGQVTVAEDDYHRARMLLASQNLPRGNPGGYAILDQLQMGVSRAVEGERLRQARETELARSIQEIDAVAEARVHLASPERSVFVRDQAAPTALVIVKLEPGRTLGEAQVRSIVNLVASSVPNMRPEGVTIVDQAGALLSRPAGEGGANALGDARIDFERRVEDKYRQQITQLLTPLLGAGNFSAEIQADVDLDESQATRETYDREGVVRAEQGQWTGAPRDGAQAPGGIPGALANAPPAAASVVQPTPTPTPAATPTPAGATTPGAQPTPIAIAPAEMRQSDSFTRTYDLGKQVSVTRATPGAVRRLSVAVVLREEPGRPRGRVEIQQITELVRAAVGYNAQRQDQVTVISRRFNPAPVGADYGPAWYEASWFALVARNVTAIVIALLVLFLGVRPLARALMKKREEATPANRPALAMANPALGQPGGPAVDASMLDQPGEGFDERVGMVRGFTRDNPARAALAVRDMINADAGR